MSKIEKLEGMTWTNSTPLIMYTRAAYELDSKDHHFYMVTWWGDEPTSFSRFEFTGVISGGYEITLADERVKTIKALESDEWVLVFAQ